MAAHGELTTRIAVVGAGAMGQLFGARLTAAGNDVVLIDTSAEVVRTLTDGGVTLEIDGRLRTVAVTTAHAEDVDGSYDLVLVFTKALYTEQAVESVRHLIGPATQGLTLQNGLGNAEVIAKCLGEARTWVGVTDYPADLRRPGHVVSTDNATIRFGPFAGGRPAEAARMSALLGAAGLHAEAVADVHTALWEKVAFNAALNTIGAVTGYTVGEVGASAECRQLAEQVLDETAAVASAQRIPFDRDRVRAAVRSAFAHHGRHKSSMLQDREAGRPTESRLIGERSSAGGEEVGVPTPVLRTLAVLADQPPGGAGH